VLLVIKTRRACVDEIERVWRTLHPYDVPELVVVVVEHVEAKYARWLLEETGAARGE
jgi:uncharacterized protein involved in tolerance to divalent cations